MHKKSHNRHCKWLTKDLTSKDSIHDSNLNLVLYKDSEPDLKLLFFRTLLDWFSVWRNQPFSSILDFLDFCNVRFWFVHPCILPVYLGVSLFLISMNLYYLSKKKKKKKRFRTLLYKPYSNQIWVLGFTNGLLCKSNLTKDIDFFMCAC